MKYTVNIFTFILLGVVLLTAASGVAGEKTVKYAVGGAVDGKSSGAVEDRDAFGAFVRLSFLRDNPEVAENRLEESLPLLEKVMTRWPDDEIAYALASSFIFKYAKEDKIEPIIQLFSDLSRRFPQSLNLRILHCQGFFASMRNQECREVILKTLEELPDGWKNHKLLEIYYIIADRPEQLMLEEHISKMPETYANLALQFTRLRSFFLENNREKVREIAFKMIGSNGLYEVTAASFTALFAGILKNSGETVLLNTYLENLFEASADNPDIIGQDILPELLLWAVTSSVEVNNLPMVDKALDIMFSSLPESHQLYTDVVKFLLERDGKPEELWTNEEYVKLVVRACEIQMLRNGRNDKTMTDMALAYFSCRRYDMALAMLDRVRQRTAVWEILRLEALYNLGRYEEVIQEALKLQQNDEHNPVFLAQVARICGHAASIIGDKQLAVQQLRRALQLTPADYNLANSLAYTYAELGENLDEAEKLIDVVLKKEPHNASYLDTLAWIYFRQGRNTEALEAMAQTVGASAVSDELLTSELYSEIVQHTVEMLRQAGFEKLSDVLQQKNNDENKAQK